MKVGYMVAVLLAGLFLVSGCGGQVAEAEVSGTVLIDNLPLKEGFILFEEADKSKTPVEGKIVDGKYTLKVPPGSKIVRINASRPARKIDPVMGAAARESMIPKEFNSESTLKREIKAGQNEGMDFQVKSIP